MGAWPTDGAARQEGGDMPRISDERGRLLACVIAVAVLIFTLSDLLLLAREVRLLIEDFGTRF